MRLGDQNLDTLEPARSATIAVLDDFVRKGLINRYEEWESLDEEDELEEGDALYFVAYADSPWSVERRLIEISSVLIRKYKIPIFIVTFKEVK
jgi:hypothetical protein